MKMKKIQIKITKEQYEVLKSLSTTLGGFHNTVRKTIDAGLYKFQEELRKEEEKLENGESTINSTNQ